MMEEINGDLEPCSFSSVNAGDEHEVTVIKGKAASMQTTITAKALWLGGIHFTVALVLAALFLLPTRLGLTYLLPYLSFLIHSCLFAAFTHFSIDLFRIFALFLFLMVIPVDEKSKPGERLARYISKNVCGYFPVTLYVEDIKAFDPNQSCSNLLEIPTDSDFFLLHESWHSCLLPEDYKQVMLSRPLHVLWDFMYPLIIELHSQLPKVDSFLCVQSQIFINTKIDLYLL